MSVASALSALMRGYCPKRSRLGLWAGKQIIYGTRFSKDYKRP